MAIRADLEREREALQALLDDLNESAWGRGSDGVPALTASIARLDALLSLSDEAAATLCTALDAAAKIAAFTDEPHASCLRTVAGLVRRTS